MHRSQFFRLVLAVAAIAVLTDCKLVEGGYERHHNSRLYPNADTKGQFIFEATIAPGMPAESKNAEAERIAWLESWLEWGNHCSAGYRILDRREIGPKDTNRYGHDLRYWVACVEPAQPAEENETSP